MAVEIRSKSGKLMGFISDDLETEDFLVIGRKKVPLAQVYSDQELMDAFNKSVKGEEEIDDQTDK